MNKEITPERVLNVIAQLHEIESRHAVVIQGRQLCASLPEGDDKAILSASLDHLELVLAGKAAEVVKRAGYVAEKPAPAGTASAAAAPAQPSWWTGLWKDFVNRVYNSE